jgi:type IV secretion system protein VirB2
MKKLLNPFVFAVAAAACSPAFAQLQKGNQALNMVQTWLLGIAGVLCTIAFMFVGFRMMFNAAQFKDVAPVFWGAVIVGGAAGIAALLLS